MGWIILISLFLCMSNQFPLYCVIRDHNSVVDQVAHQYEFSDLKKIQNQLFKSLNVDLESLRNDIIKLARKTLDGKFNYIFNNLEEFNDSIDNLHNQWVFFTDNDDWCYPYFHNHIQSKLFTIDNSTDMILWNHLCVHFNKNQYICMNPSILTYIENLVQTNNSIVCLNENFFNFEIIADWKTNIFDKFQHWHQDTFYHKAKDVKLLTLFDDSITAWNKNMTSMSIIKDYFLDNTCSSHISRMINMLQKHLDEDCYLLYQSLKFNNPKDKRNSIEYKDWQNNNSIDCINHKKFLSFYNDLVNEQKEIYKFYFKNVLTNTS